MLQTLSLFPDGPLRDDVGQNHLISRDKVWPDGGHRQAQGSYRGGRGA
jgi:hypothetical protein